jgi:hypothetical protein
MAYGGIDKKRFAYLLSLGTDGFELKQFFSDCRIQLIQRGGKVQNLPQGSKARIQMLASGLPPSADGVVRSWFSSHITMVDPEESEAVVAVFKRYEELNEELAEDSARRFSRSCLVHLFSEKPSQSLLDFLKTPVGIQTEEREDTGDITDVPYGPPPGDWYSESLPQVLIDLVEGKDADEHLAFFPPELATFISGLQLAKQGQTELADQAADALSENSVLGSPLKQYIGQQVIRKGASEGLCRGLRVMGSELFDGSFDYEHDEILAYCTSAASLKAVFVHPMAVVRGRKIQLLSVEKRRELFPEEGDVMAFSGAQYPRQPRRGEMGIWRVAEHPTDKAAHFHLSSEKRTVYEVRVVPFPSTDYDSVREFLMESAERSGGASLQPLVFVLNDGLLVGARGERPDLSKEEAFESGLLSWKGLEAIRLEGRLFIAGPLPKEHGVYECAGLPSTVRKLFKPLLGGDKAAGGLTKAQLSYLAQSLDSTKVELDGLRIQRVKTQLERLGDQHEAINTLADELFKHPDVKERIDQLVQKEASKQLKYKNGLQADIARLQKEREEWEERSRKQREESRKLPDGISKAVKAAFLKARADGLSTLAEVAIFQALSEPAEASNTFTEARAGRSGPLAQPTVRDLVPTGGEAVTILRALGVSAQAATAFAIIGEVARRAGLMVCVRGVAARPAVEGWAKTYMLRSVLIDSTIGLVDDSAVKNILLRVPPLDGLVLLDANLSALDIYARPLSDLVLTRLADAASENPLGIFVSLADGVGALPLPRTFECISVLIDLDARYVFRGVADMDELMSEAINPEDGALYARLWRPAAERLRKQIEDLEPEERALALSVLIRK